MWRVFILTSVIVLGACSGPEHQKPVPLLPGLYEIKAGGNGTLFLKNGALEAQQCLSPTDAVLVTGDALGTLAYPWERCQEKPDLPRRNAISGQRICGPDDQGRPWAHIRFAGSHTQESFQLEGHVSHPGDGGGLMSFGSGDFTITGKRVGDC